MGFPFRLWWLNINCLACALASFTWVKATQKWLFPLLLLVIVQPCNGPCLVKGLNQKRTRLITLIFSHCNLMGGKVSLLPWCIASHAYVTPTELCSLSCISQEWHFQIKVNTGLHNPCSQAYIFRKINIASMKQLWFYDHYHMIMIIICYMQ